MNTKGFFGHPPAGVESSKLRGSLIVIEGMDSAGRSTHIRLLSQWLEEKGYAVVETGLKRSTLVSDELNEAKKGNILSSRTMSLFYATDFYDQLENKILPAMKAGCVVLADRYIYTLMVRDILRGADREWIRSLYGMALVPDAVFLLNASQRVLIDRTLRSNQSLDYWESGMDLGLSRDWFDSLVRYQRMARKIFMELQAEHGLMEINANASVGRINAELRSKIETVLESSYL